MHWQGEYDSRNMEQCKNSLLLNLLYTEYCHNTDFSYLNKRTLKEVEGIKTIMFFDRVSSRFDYKLHIINDK